MCACCCLHISFMLANIVTLFTSASFFVKEQTRQIPACPVQSKVSLKRSVIPFSHSFSCETRKKKYIYIIYQFSLPIFISFFFFLHASASWVQHPCLPVNFSSKVMCFITFWMPHQLNPIDRGLCNQADSWMMIRIVPDSLLCEGFGMPINGEWCGVPWRMTVIHFPPIDVMSLWQTHKLWGQSQTRFGTHLPALPFCRPWGYLSKL